jgi:hypothetical protein
VDLISPLKFASVRVIRGRSSFNPQGNLSHVMLAHCAVGFRRLLERKYGGDVHLQGARLVHSVNPGHDVTVGGTVEFQTLHARAGTGTCRTASTRASPKRVIATAFIFAGIESFFMAMIFRPIDLGGCGSAPLGMWQIRGALA